MLVTQMSPPMPPHLAVKALQIIENRFAYIIYGALIFAQPILCAN